MAWEPWLKYLSVEEPKKNKKPKIKSKVILPITTTTTIKTKS